MSERKFKVVDRRRFTEEGDERHSEDIREEKPEIQPEAVAQPAAPEPPAEAPKAAEQNADEEVAEGGLTFDIFIQSLAQQAMMQLGLIPWPHTGERGLQLEQARDTIDVMDLLEKKTRGNLNDKEKNLLTTVLYELRMSYMEINQRMAQAALEQNPPTS